MEDKPKSKDALIKEIALQPCEPEELYLPTDQDLAGYEWAQYYVAPNDDVMINWKNMRLFWYWISERLSIWYKRTIEKLPFPWTDDKILQQNKFTNCLRDLDKGTVYYIKNILEKMDEPCDDIVTRTKEVMLNTMIYRLFLKRETWETIGFIYLDSWDEQWARAVTELRAKKQRGETIWHNAYYVNGLKKANPDPKTNLDKLENAICLCEIFHNKIDEVYDFVTTHDMRECLEYLVSIPAVAEFTVYEWLCDWSMSYRYVEHTVVDWTDDSYTNVGPGNKRGLDFIFAKRGNLSYFECDLYLRASWQHYMKRYGYYDQFIQQLPANMDGDINLRVIEHDCCELQKYLSVMYGIGQTKAKFKNESKDCLDDLIL